MLRGMGDTYFDEWIAERYEQLWPHLFAPDVIEPALDCLYDLAGGGACLEFGIGTGRIGIALARRGVTVHGIELSEAMVRRLRAQPGGDGGAVTIGDFASTAVGGMFSLVYLLRNTITNLTTQDEQVNCFRNAAAHLGPGGLFLIENYIPQLQRVPPGDTGRVFAAEPDHLGLEDYNLAAQIAVSTHYWVIDGELRTFSSPHRYLWPQELDLMAKLAGLTLRHRWSDWHRNAFTSDSPGHSSVWQKPAEHDLSPSATA
jgi:SAM-dependent methyltransferase